MQEKGNREANEKNDKLKEIKPDIRPWKEINRCRNDQTVINRLRTDHTLLTHGYLFEGQPVPQCEL